MKKPNITEGKWKTNIGNQSLADTGDYIPYAEIEGQNKQNIGQCFENMEISIEQQIANAKAISAVPDMIDALIYAHKSMSRKSTIDNRIWNEIDKALKKAGCENE